MEFYTFMICLVLVLTVTSASVNRIEEEKVECRTRSDDYLEQRLLILKHYYEYKLPELRIKFKLNIKDNLNYPIPRDTKYIYNETQCMILKRPTILLNEKSICPWQVETKYRVDKFPRYLSHAVCTCKRCNSVSDVFLNNMYRCMPVLTPHLVLTMENECDSEGYYIWTEDVELVNVACICGVDFDLNPQ